MNYHDFYNSIEKICVLVAITYLAGRTRAFEQIAGRVHGKKGKLAAFCFFMVLAVVEVILSPGTQPLDSRIIAATAAGLFAGSVVGICTGIVTALASAIIIQPSEFLVFIPAVIGGALAGSISTYKSEFRLKVLGGFLAGAICHGLWLGIRFWESSLLAPWDVLIIRFALPMFLSGVGVSLFLIILGDIRGQRERIERSELTRALEVAQNALPNIGSGLGRESAKHICETVCRLTGLPAVSIFTRQAVLGHAGVGCKTHRNSVSTLGESALEAGDEVFFSSQSSCFGECGECGFTSAAAASLEYAGNVIGGIIMYETENVRIVPDVAQLGLQVARFLTSYQMQLAEIESQSHALSKAELKMLQAQVHPHFLFNALTTIAGLCEINPRQASILTVKLGEFFRSSLRSEREFISTLRDEISFVRNYLEIEQARLGERMEVIEDIEPKALECRLPSYSLQPIVENAVLHGISKKTGDTSIRIAARIKRERLVCWVIDSGRGFDDKSIDWFRAEAHAIPMLYGRLSKMYGREFGFKIRSRPGKGTLVYLWVPVTETTENRDRT